MKTTGPPVIYVTLGKVMGFFYNVLHGGFLRVLVRTVLKLKVGN